MTATIPGQRQPADDTAPNADIAELVARAQAGDGDAFGLIYDRYFNTVYRFVYFRVHGNRQLAEDLTADTFLRALRRIGTFTWQGHDLGAWLVTITRNRVTDHYRSSRYHYEQPTELFDTDTDDRPATGPEGRPENAVIDHLANLDLLKAVKQLNPEQQECIVLRYLQGFSVAETAQAMGKTGPAVKSLQYRAVQNIAHLHPELRPVAQ